MHPPPTNRERTFSGHEAARSDTCARGVRAAIAAVFVATVACAPTTVWAVTSELALRPDPTPPPAATASRWASCRAAETYASSLAPIPVAPLPLRGDPGFDPSALGPEARRWYDRLWDAIGDAERSRSITSLAARDDLYHYSRTLHTHVLALLTAFRATGDLALLDEVDRLAEHMRSVLRDPWRDTLDGSDGVRDGFVNWVFRTGNSREHQGKDVHTFDEMRTHALVAEIAWALHHNRDLPSPNGVDYGRHADLWTAYLLEHFEPKWRQRNDVAPGRFPFLESASLHATAAFVKYHHYLARITGSTPHQREAVRLARLLEAHMVRFEHAGATAVVWPRTLTLEGGTRDYLQPTTYARYVIGDLVDLHLDGFAPWSTETIEAVTHTVRSFVLRAVDGEPTLARDIGGGQARGGLEATDPDDWSPPTLSQHSISPTSFVTAWDRSGALAALTCAVEDTVPSSVRSVHLPAAMLLAFSDLPSRR